MFMFFVCKLISFHSDANGMAPAVRACWVKLLVAYRALTQEAAEILVSKWQSERKYLSDIWA